MDSTELASTVDTHMYRVLRGTEDAVSVVAELAGTLTERSNWADPRCAGFLYRVFAELTDIVDGFPHDYGPAAELIAQREIRDAAWDWLSIPRTAENMWDYVTRWENRIGALPTLYEAGTKGSIG